MIRKKHDPIFLPSSLIHILDNTTMGKYNLHKEEQIKECLFIIKNNPSIKLAKLAREKHV